LLLGNQGSGKTSFLKSLIGKSISNTLSTTGIDTSSFECQIKREKIKFQIYDTVGQEKYRSISINYYRKTDSFLLFFDVTNEESFTSVKFWIESILKNNGSLNGHYELFLVANKIDETEMRKVGKKEGKELATKYKIKYFEISCLKKINIYELLYEITLETYKKYKRFEKTNESFQLRKKKSNKKTRNFC
jgi:small GTP-binding protein